MKHITIVLLLIICLSTHAQQRADSATVNLEEVIITASTGINHDRQSKPLSSVEEYLQSSEKVNMIKRGNYAWEPAINSMTAERISVTVEGMKIFHACTDRMDPVTSYVETVNLSKISLGSGFEANANASNNIGGSLDLRLNKTGFCADGWDINARTGYESNGNAQIYGVDLSYANPDFYLNSGLFRRQSDNYRAGGNEEIAFSQFAKNNVFANIGYVVADGKAVEGTLIYDRASDVGYPALAMDVKKAEGLISSVSYTVENPVRHFYKWENRMYYNNIIHVMDDTKRPDVVMHMDMPGKSRTGGAYSTLSGRNGKHRYSFNWDAYYNQSYAEMTMYSGNPAEIPMFMLTWGDIRTLNTGLFAVDEYSIGNKHSVRLSAKGSFQRDGVQSSFGLNTLQIYYPGMQRYRNRFAGNISGRYGYSSDEWEIGLNAGFGSRSPSVSEAYGFYLFNTFDAYDYLGNPYLKQESALETGFSMKWTKSAFDAKAELSYFYFDNYIIGKPDAGLSSMTSGASGVKVYRNLPHAAIMNASMLLKYRFPDCLSWNGKITYARGHDDNKNNLPLIAPLNYEASLRFGYERFFAEAGIAGAAQQTNFSPEYGEDKTENYLTANISAGYGFKISGVIVNIKSGIENLFDTRYSTYADWNNIPRKGRNIFINCRFNI
jgi:iron complex outermembrane receptor protein